MGLLKTPDEQIKDIMTNNHLFDCFQESMYWVNHLKDMDMTDDKMYRSVMKRTINHIYSNMRQIEKEINIEEKNDDA